MLSVTVTALDVALASAIAAGVVGLPAPLSTWLVARRTLTSSEQLARDERQYAARLDTYGEAMTLAYQMQAIAIQSVVAMDSGELMPDPEGHYDTAKTLEVAGRMEVGSATLSRPADLVRSVSKKSAGRSCS